MNTSLLKVELENSILKTNSHIIINNIPKVQESIIRDLFLNFFKKECKSIGISEKRQITSQSIILKLKIDGRLRDITFINNKSTYYNNMFDVLNSTVSTIDFDNIKNTGNVNSPHTIVDSEKTVHSLFTNFLNTINNF